MTDGMRCVPVQVVERLYPGLCVVTRWYTPRPSLGPQPCEWATWTGWGWVVVQLVN
jgi:hypothetical protein